MYPRGFSLHTNASGSMTVSYLFDTEAFEKGRRYRYQWWSGIPKDYMRSFFEEISDIFTRDDSILLLEGFFENK